MNVQDIFHGDDSKRGWRQAWKVLRYAPGLRCGHKGGVKEEAERGLAREFRKAKAMIHVEPAPEARMNCYGRFSVIRTRELAFSVIQVRSISRLSGRRLKFLQSVS
jgi:hypothetical protein